MSRLRQGSVPAAPALRSCTKAAGSKSAALCPEGRRCRVVVVENPRLGDMVAIEVEDVCVPLIKRLIAAGSARAGQYDYALVSLGNLIDDHAERAVGVCVQAAKLGHHGIDAVKVPRALTRRVPSDVTGKQRPQRVHVSS